MGEKDGASREDAEGRRDEVWDCVPAKTGHDGAGRRKLNAAGHTCLFFLFLLHRFNQVAHVKYIRDRSPWGKWRQPLTGTLSNNMKTSNHVVEAMFIGLKVPDHSYHWRLAGTRYDGAIPTERPSTAKIC